MLPKASILWVNYNSMPIIDVVLHSLSAVNELDYPNLELVVIDNGSTDGSFNVIRSFLKKMKVRVKVWRLNSNLGFAGGNNVAYRLADDDSSYIVLLNNDAAPYPHSLREIIECLDSMPEVGAAQGIIYKMNRCEVETAGNFLNELLTSYSLKRNPGKSIPITYPTGCYAVIKRSALKRIGLVNRLFIGESFAYFDDNYLGMKLWNHGYKVISLPIKAGVHYGSASFKRYSLFRSYNIAKAWIARIFATNTKWKSFAILYYFKKFMMRRSRIEKMILLKAYIDGLKLARKVDEVFNIYKMPIITFPEEILFKIPFYLALQRYLSADMAKASSKFFDKIGVHP